MAKGRINNIDGRFYAYPTDRESYLVWIGQPMQETRELDADANEALIQKNVARRLRAHRESREWSR